MPPSNRGVLAVQHLHHTHDLSNEQARWLKRVLESRPKKGAFDRFTIPEDVQDVLVEKGLIRRWRNGTVEITLDGICEVARRRLAQDETVAVPKSVRRVPA
jgi:hypothetical protein